MDTVHLLALGPTMLEAPNFGYFMGVNDVHKYAYTHELVVVDEPEKFSPDRKKVIWHSQPANGFWSPRKAWQGHSKFRFFPLAYNHNNHDIDHHGYIFSNNSPFVAAVHAYKQGYKDIVLWGVDFFDHPRIKADKKVTAKKHYQWLDRVLSNKGVSLYAGSNHSPLSQYLPTWACQSL